MQLNVEQVIDNCLSAIASPEPDYDRQQAWVAALDALARHIDLTQGQLSHIKKLLRQQLPSSTRVVLTRILVLGTQRGDIAEFFSSYLKALVSNDRRASDEGEILKDFYNRRTLSAIDFWRECVEVLGLDETVGILAGISITDLPADAAALVLEEERAVRRSHLVWDFVMVATPSAWRYHAARRPDFRTKYWHALLDWPYQGDGANSSQLVAEKIVSLHEARILEEFGERLRAHLDRYESMPTQSSLVADRSLEAIGDEALRAFFGSEFQRTLTTLYSGRVIDPPDD